MSNQYKSDTVDFMRTRFLTLLSVALSSFVLTAWGGDGALVELPRVAAHGETTKALPAQARPEEPPGKGPKDKEPPGKGPPPKGPQLKVEDEMGGVVTVSKYTDAGLSKQLGVPLAFLYLAGNACDLRLKCTSGLKDRLQGPAQDWSDHCKINLAQAWCAKGRCKADALDPNGAQWVDCYKNVYSRDCAQLSAPVACKVLGDKALTLAPTDWKE
jgi:hypothetical protein